MSVPTPEFHLTSGNYPPLPEIGDFSPEAIAILAELNRDAPVEPSTLQVAWWAVPTLQVIAEGESQRATITGLGMSETSVNRHLRTLRRDLGAGNVNNMAHRALSVGVLAVPPVTIEPEPLDEVRTAILQNTAAGMQRRQIGKWLVAEGLIRRWWTAELAIKSFRDDAGAQTGPGLLYWAHTMGHLSPLRKQPLPRQYIRAMSQTSRARRFLAKMYPEAQDRLQRVPNAAAIGAALLVPNMIPHKSRGPALRTALHQRCLEAWIGLDRYGLQLWAEVEGVSPGDMAGMRDDLVVAAKGYIPLEKLLAAGAEAVTPET